MRTEFAKGYCSHPEARDDSCSDTIIRAHTIQRRGGLASIAENGHVISAISAAHDIFKNNGKFVPRLVGTRGASTFAGFCNRHDTEMFRPVETQPVVLTLETCFLLAFRAISYEYFAKQAQSRVAEIWRSADAGRPFEIQCMIQEFVYTYRAGLLRGLSDTKRWKEQYDAIYRERRFGEHRFVAIEYSEILPIVGCGAFHPEYDFSGHPLQRISRGNTPHEHVTFNLSVLGNCSVLVLGMSEGENGPAETLLRSFASLPDEKKADAAIRLAFEHIENIFFKPTWWSNLNEGTRNALIRRMRSGLLEIERESGCLKSDGHEYSSNRDITTTVVSL